MEPSWKQADVFPLIARVIGELYRKHQRHVPARDIAARLVHDSQARPLIEHARQQLGESHTLEWLAGNMVAWFSQRITVGESAWRRTIDRVKIEDQWAYRPATTDTS